MTERWSEGEFRLDDQMMRCSDDRENEYWLPHMTLAKYIAFQERHLFNEIQNNVH